MGKSNTSPEYLIEAINRTDVGMIVIDSERRILFINDWIKIHATVEGAVEDKFIHEVFPDLPPRLNKAMEKALSLRRAAILSNKLNPAPFPFYRDKQSLTERTLISQVVKIKPINVTEQFCLIEIIDISESVNRETALHQLASEAQLKAEQIEAQEKRIRGIFESVKDAIIIVDAGGSIQMFNHTANELLNSASTSLSNINLHQFLKDKNKPLSDENGGVNQMAAMLPLWAKYADSIELEVTPSGQDGSFFAELSVSTVELSEQRHFVVVLRDITERKQYEQQLETMAKFDELTSLPNRTLLMDRIQSAIGRAKRFDNNVAILFLDLDRFKIINDTLGHDIGDKLLQSVSTRLNEGIRDLDTVARLGGDEFVILLENLEHKEHAARVAEKIVTLFEPAFDIDGHQLFVTGSLGIATYPESGETAYDLIKCADTAMYAVKDSSRNNYMFFSEKMNENAKKRLELEAELRIAVKKAQFSIVLQPQLSPDKKILHGAEVLVRWYHPTKGFISPVDFIPIAEDSGFIEQIFDSVLGQACEFLANYKHVLPQHFRMGVNISPRQFISDTFTQRFMAVLTRYQLDTHFFELELTEGMLMKRTDETISLLRTLVDKGFVISIDDFGTGYSSLAYLTRFPLHTLKIDRSFIVDLPNDEEAALVCKSIIGLAKNLGLNLIAEGVETEQQNQFLAAENCDVIQGYYFAKPMPVDEFLVWLDAFNAESL
ncbi:EAL domain-containing protein [Pseudoalteromonas sp. SMS1]|uniref:putative bifunctional diguanylate cyclase/phosphodiesterase n=1 Tax=Pseudoalteromonas sp. SMS1 TaxID=2908894 RepID=UPI001F299688|nr:EAL domain-containing protein [Pseudoalteromonas sp. SMS1]MCF2860046.1 EAL domain-containing protein [Pseudoalteromonas sp. SMS1]